MLSVTAAALTTGLILSSCGGATTKDAAPTAAPKSCVDTSGDTVKLGFLNSLTGGMAISEKTVSKTLHMAADEINASGGILGKKIVPIQEDGATDWPTFAEKEEKLLTKDCVAATFGGWTSSSRKAVKPVVEKYNGLFFYPVQYEGLESSKNIYYTGATTNQQIIPAMDFLKAQGVKTLFLAGSDYVFPRTANAIIKLYAAKLGIKIVGEEYVPLDKADWTTQVAKIVKAKPDFVFNTINGSSNVGFVKAYYDAGLSPKTTPIISVSIAEEEAPAMGHDVSGNYASWNYFESIKSPANAKFIADWKKYPGNSGVTSDPMEAAYDSLYLYKELVEKAGSFDVDKINAAAKKYKITFNAPEGLITLDGENHHISKVANIGQIQPDNQFKIVWSSGTPIAPDPYLKGYDWFPAATRDALVKAAG
ncbi:urea ABC transporter substrate-binding protein [Nocardioides jejuensis]|uniref:Urea ABC transporter substrate-binding protein n=1 Tax=Nocardioides jejuensis TaxID=2502782 RepID=A0A4R1BZA2_9ACTN|nr:urea ABC transporter substrate-binding protein [Nocardioides jejuensis]TCJ23381.1 urea ABC transporter substrate-binding protein [Nocardioides jejuensis]